MLRFLIGAGLLLMAVGFGAAGLQYWQSRPQVADAAPAAPSAPPGQGWLISSSGGLVPERDVRAYLIQDRLTPERMLRVTRTARLAELLLDGEKLPEPPYLEVLADIRAPKIAEPLCAVLAQGPAALCQINAARVVPGSVDPVAGTARFGIELAFHPAPAAEALPDLATHVLTTRDLQPDLAADPAARATPEAALAATLAATTAACAEAAGTACRVLDLTLDWAPDRAPVARARIAWLSPLPEGIEIAPPLASPPEG